MNIKKMQYLIQHLSMLPCHGNYRIYLFLLLKRFHQRCHLNGFGPRTKNDKYFFHRNLLA